MNNNIKVDIEIIDEDDKMVSSDTETSIDYDSLDIDHLSLKQFLYLIKNIDENNIEIAPRIKNLEFSDKFQLSDSLLKQEIKSLTEADYFDGPLPDDNPKRKHPIWIFKKYVQKVYCYIKIKIINHGRFAIIISFHEDN